MEKRKIWRWFRIRQKSSKTVSKETGINIKVNKFENSVKFTVLYTHMELL